MSTYESLCGTVLLCACCPVDISVGTLMMYIPFRVLFGPRLLFPLLCTKQKLQVSDPDNGVLGTGAHSDYGLMTMLATVSKL